MNRHVAVLILLVFNACGAFAQQHQAALYVIMISFDGFSNEYTEAFGLKNFKKIENIGAVAEGLIPSFPSKTFPNHYSLITGLYPGNHGLVDNYFYDPVHKIDYNMRRRESVTNPLFYQGTPLWKLCREKGIRTASYFWIGSVVNKPDVQPDHFFHYDQSVPAEKRLQQVLDWLRLPEIDRPRFITLYFSSPDTEAHTFGPMSREARNITLSLDSLMGNFFEDVGATGLPVNFVLVSDHGMKALQNREETYVYLDELILTNNNVKVINGGTQAHIYTQNERQADSVYTILDQKKAGYRVIKRKEFPSQWHYNNPRAGDILMIADSNRYIVSGTREKVKNDWRNVTTFGAHGYDPYTTPAMQGIFYAFGPNIKAGIRVPAFENVHVYSFIAMILGLDIPPHDGNPAVLQGIIKK